MRRPVSRRAWMLAFMLAVHGAVTVRAMMEMSYLDLFAFAFGSWPAFQIFSDLTVTITLVSSWMVWDARQTGRVVWPWLLATLALGSFSPLLYLLTGELRRRPVDAGAQGESVSR